MRGHFLHNEVILGTVVEALSARGYQVRVEHPVCLGQRPPCVDLLVEVHGKRVVIEAECSTARIANDCVKARRLSADILLIILPHTRLKVLAVKRLPNFSASTGLEIQVLTPGGALDWISSNCPPVTQNQNVRSLKPHHKKRNENTLE